MSEATDLDFASRLLEVTSDCTVCGLCEAVAPEVFAVTAAGCSIRPGDWRRFGEGVRLAEGLCPSGAIRVRD